MQTVYNSPDFDRTIIEDRYLVYQFDHMGQTLLHWAVKNNDFKMCQLLIQRTISQGKDEI